jgi:hypothetical protein
MLLKLSCLQQAWIWRSANTNLLQAEDQLDLDPGCRSGSGLLPGFVSFYWDQQLLTAWFAHVKWYRQVKTPRPGDTVIRNCHHVTSTHILWVKASHLGKLQWVRWEPSHKRGRLQSHVWMCRLNTGRVKWADLILSVSPSPNNLLHSAVVGPRYFASGGENPFLFCIFHLWRWTCGPHPWLLTGLLYGALARERPQLQVCTLLQNNYL